MSASSDGECIAIIGLGLIGGSIARDLRREERAGTLVGCVATDADAARVRELDLVDDVTTDPATAVRDASLVVIAVPVGAMAAVLAQIGPALAPHAVIADVGSTKRSVIADARASLGDRIGRFVPGHPIAGTEHSGIDAGLVGLYRGRRVILTPTPQTDADALAPVRALWERLGGQVTVMDPAHHDEVLAATSHLPHVLAFALVDTLARMAERTEIFDYAAGGFADFTRIASSDPQLWGDIVTANTAAVLPVLDRYIGDLETVRSAIANGDRDTLVASFSRAKQARDRLSPNGGKDGN